jgi:hypothetical protein
VKLPEDKWMDYIPQRPCDNDDSEDDEVHDSTEYENNITTPEDYDEEEEAPVITIASNSDDEEETLKTSDCTGFDADEYSDILMRLKYWDL